MPSILLTAFDQLLEGCDHFVGGRRRLRGISLTSMSLLMTLLAETECGTTATVFDVVSSARKHAQAAGTQLRPPACSEDDPPEGAQRRCPPPSLTYRFQKLWTRQFTRGGGAISVCLDHCVAFNCFGIGQKERWRLQYLELGARKPRCRTWCLRYLVQKV